MFRVALTIVFLLAAEFAGASAPSAADMPESGPPAIASSQGSEVRDYISRSAILHILRSAFDVEPADDIESVLTREARQADASGISAADLDQLNRDLLAEGSYYLVSLRYLILAEGAVWPQDRSEASYRNDALARLADLQRELFDAVDDQADPIAIFEAADEINAWTEGYATVPADEDHFAVRDALVEEAMKAYRPKATT